MLAQSFLLCTIGLFCTCSVLADTQIGGDFHIRSARWPDHYLDVDWSGTVEFTTNPKDDKTVFTLWLPSSEAQQANPRYLIYSKWWDDSTLFIKETAYAGGVRHEAWCDTASGDLSSSGLYLVRAPVESPTENRTLVMFGSPKYASMYMWSGNSYDVRAREDDPGAGGYWWFDPALPLEFQEGLPDYTGALCSWGCGEVSEEVGLAMCAGPSGMLTAFAGLVLLLGVLS